MQTVNFRCGHCGQMLAVQDKYLGAQVRCPHCQKVIVAPATNPSQTAAPSPPPPVPAPPPPAPPRPAPVPTPPTLSPAIPGFNLEIKPPDEHESIFSAPTAADDVFGQPAPRIEMPEAPAAPAPAPLPFLEPAPEQLPTVELNPLPTPSLPGDATLPYVSGQAPTPVSAFGDIPTVPQATAPAPLPWTPSDPDAHQEPEPLRDPATEALLRKPRSRSGWHIALVIIPLISAAILGWVAAGILWFRDQNRPTPVHPLENMPDIDGDFPTNRKNSQKQVRERLASYRMPPARTPLPERLKVALGKSITLGELEITPFKVDRQRVQIVSARSGGEPESPTEPALRLHLRFRNLSSDLAFCPMDRYFTRYWRLGQKKDQLRWVSDAEPFTYLEVGNHRFYGGPAGWYDLRDGKWTDEKVVGQNFHHRLEPGQTWETFICADPQDEKLPDYLQRYRDRPLLWRVHVRRGSEMVSGRRIPCTSVIGVEFMASDIGAQ